MKKIQDKLSSGNRHRTFTYKMRNKNWYNQKLKKKKKHCLELLKYAHLVSNKNNTNIKIIIRRTIPKIASDSWKKPFSFKWKSNITSVISGSNDMSVNFRWYSIPVNTMHHYFVSKKLKIMEFFVNIPSKNLNGILHNGANLEQTDIFFL